MGLGVLLGPNEADSQMGPGVLLGPNKAYSQMGPAPAEVGLSHAGTVQQGGGTWLLQRFNACLIIFSFFCQKMGG